MYVHLTPDLEQFVQDKVQAGRYNSASEVIGDALRLLGQNDELRDLQLQELRSRIDKGLSEASRGEDGEVFMRGLIEDLDTEPDRKAG